MAKQHIIGVKIGGKSPASTKKTYYYKTDKEIKKGDEIRVKVPSGGTPKSKVVVTNSNKKFTKPVKELKEG